MLASVCSPVRLGRAARQPAGPRAMVRHLMGTQSAAREHPGPDDPTPNRTVLITGGAGFVGSNVAIGLTRRQHGLGGHG